MTSTVRTRQFNPATEAPSHVRHNFLRPEVDLRVHAAQLRLGKSQPEIRAGIPAVHETSK